MHYLGIDPGLNGSLTLIDNNKTIVKVDKIPTVKIKKNEYDIAALFFYLSNIKYAYPSLFCVVEKAQAMPQQGVTSMFKIGMGYGILLGLLTSLSIPHSEVHPRVWTTKLFKGTGGKGKQRAYLVARKLFPEWEPKFKYQYEWADSILIAEYARRIYKENA